MPDMAADPRIRQRTEELVAEAAVLLDAIRSLGDGGSDPLADADVLAQAIKIGLLDAPHLCGNPHAAGKLATAPIDGAIRAVDLATGEALTEQERIDRLL
jgi:hypothetical protein